MSVNRDSDYFVRNIPSMLWPEDEEELVLYYQRKCSEKHTKRSMKGDHNMELERYFRTKVGRIAHLRGKAKEGPLETNLQSELEFLEQSATKNERDIATILSKRSEACGD